MVQNEPTLNPETIDENSQETRAEHYVGGDMVGGDKTSVGDISNAKGVAIGSGSTVVINENPRKPLILLLGGLIVAVIIIAIIPLLIKLLPKELPVLELGSKHLIEEVSTDLLQDVVVQDGIVWLTTRNGLVRRDEDKRRNDRVWTGKWITALAKDSHNSNQIWFGTEEGELGRVDSSGKITTVDTPQTEGVTAITVDSKGQIWVADTNLGIMRYETDGTLLHELIPLPDDEYIFDIAVLTIADQNILWATTTPGLYWWKDGVWAARFDEEDNMPSGVVLNGIVVDEFGGSWVAHSEGITHITLPESLTRSGTEVQTCTSANSRLPPGSALDMVLDDGWLWITTPKGVARREVIKDTNIKPCADWQNYLPESENLWLPEALWKIDVKNEQCKVWFVALSESIAYRLTFKGC